MSDRLLLAALALCAGLIICSFLPWLGTTYFPDFGGSVTVSTSGIHVYALTGVGDGQVVAISAAIGGAVAIIAGANPDLRRFAGFVLAAVGLAAFSIAAYNLMLGDRGFADPNRYFGYYPPVSKLHGLWFTLILSIALSWVGVNLILAKSGGLSLRWVTDGAKRQPLDPVSQAAFVPLIAAGAILTVVSFLPWFASQYFEVSGQDAEVVTGAGDGYILAGLALLCLSVSIGMARAGAIGSRGLVLLLLAGTGALAISALNLTGGSDVCERNPVLGIVSTGCGEASATPYLWLATGLSAVIVFVTLAISANQLTGPLGQDTMSGRSS